MKKILFVSLILCVSLFASTINGQGLAFGLKGGLGLGTQKWDSVERSPLLIYSFSGYVESNNEYNNNNFFAQLGYHTRGSAIVFRSYTSQNGVEVPRRTTKFLFRNIELSLGFKQSRPINDDLSFYYKIGLRGEYNISTNLEEFEKNPSYFYPREAGVKKILYGFTVQGGLEFMFSELVGGNLEFSFYPDLSNQYYTPPIEDVIDPYNSGNTINIRERKIKNLSFEVTVGFRFLRKVEYYED